MQRYVIAKARGFAGTLAILTAACAGAFVDTADVFPLNDQAKRLGPVQATFARTGLGRGPVTITMGNGEVLRGEYRVAFNETEAFGFSGAASASALAIGPGNVQFVANGPRTQILCRGNSTPMGHGNGECQTYEGALWAISW